MKKILFLIILLLVLLFTAFLLYSQQSEKIALTQAALDYIEGCYEGNAARLERASHPDLTKSGGVILPQTGDFIDYLQLAKNNGQGMIVNVLWEMNK